VRHAVQRFRSPCSPGSGRLPTCDDPVLVTAVPNFTGLKRDLHAYLASYHFERAHTGRLTTPPHPRRDRLRCPQGEDEMSRTCRHISGDCPD
jgi:hypothetical protein